VCLCVCVCKYELLAEALMLKPEGHGFESYFLTFFFILF